MEAPLTPTRATARFGRCHTPPSPTHGPMHEDWEPYSPRRSSRATLKTNPFSSYNTGKVANVSPLQTPARKPPPAFKIRQGGAVPSPPISPAANSRLGHGANSHNKINDDNSNTNLGLSDENVANSSGMLPTPSKTPSMTPARKRNRAASMQDTARVLHFQQPDDPNDVMPTRRENRKRANKRAGKFSDFDLDLDEPAESGRKAKVSFEIYTESHARMPEVDNSEDNVFYRPQQSRAAPQTRTSPRRSNVSTEQIVEERRMEEAAARNEGMVYTFRGKKIFRPFEGADGNDADSEGDAINPSKTTRQRALRRAAGAVADRPLTRSSIQPRLLFSQPSLTDEEAETDIDTANAPHAARRSAPSRASINITAASGTPAKGKTQPRSMPTPITSRTSRKRNAEHVTIYQDEIAEATPAKNNAVSNVTLPTPQRSSKKSKKNDIPVYQEITPEPLSAAEEHATTPKRSSRRMKDQVQLTPIVEDETEQASTNELEHASALPSNHRPKSRSPFDNWPRVKAGAKRSAAQLEGSSVGSAGKRTRNTSSSN